MACAVCKVYGVQCVDSGHSRENNSYTHKTAAKCLGLLKTDTVCLFFQTGIPTDEYSKDSCPRNHFRRKKTFAVAMSLRKCGGWDCPCVKKIQFLKAVKKGWTKENLEAGIARV